MEKVLIFALFLTAWSTWEGIPYMQFPDYAQIRYPDGSYCVYEPWVKIPVSDKRFIECIRISAKYEKGIIPTTCTQ